MNEIQIIPIEQRFADSFWIALDTVAREKKYLALQEAPPIEKTRAFVADNIANGVPQFVAVEGETVVGWCDIKPGWPHSMRHCGGVGIGILPAYRGRGLGEQLLRITIAAAQQRGITRIELATRIDNLRAIKLYERVGFVHEGVKRAELCMDGVYFDSAMMAIVKIPKRPESPRPY